MKNLGRLFSFLLLFLGLAAQAYAYCEKGLPIHEEEALLEEDFKKVNSFHTLHVTLRGILNCESEKIKAHWAMGLDYRNYIATIVSKIHFLADRNPTWVAYSTPRVVPLRRILHTPFDIPVNYLLWQEFLKDIEVLLSIRDEFNTEATQQPEVEYSFTQGLEESPQRENYLQIFQSYHLMPEPGTVIPVENAEFILGTPFDIGDGRIGVLYGVRLDKSSQFTLRIAYRSNSQNLLRVLLAIDRSQTGPRFNKGFGEGSLTLPWAIQKATFLKFFQMRKRGQSLISIPESNLEAVVKTLITKENYLSRKQELTHSFKRKISLVPMVYEDYKPNLNEKIDHFYSESPLSNGTKVLLYHSYNHELDYMIVVERDTKRAWIGSISISKPKLNSFGVPETYCDAGNFLAPLWEYKTQIPQEFFDESTKKQVGSHVYYSNWNTVKQIIDELFVYRPRVPTPPLPE